MDRAINNLKQKILNSNSTDFEFKINEVISMGESQIEKMMLLQLYNYFQKYGRIGTDEETNDFCHLEFIEEEICLWDVNHLTNAEIAILEDKIKRFKFRYNDKKSMYYKFIGFKCTINQSESYFLSSNENSLIFRDIEIRPQFYEVMDQNHYRIDIAFILKRRDWFNDNEIIEEKKIAIECDGYDYHSSPYQKREDDKRTRKLKRKGWREVLRYSGSEIYEINTSLEKTHYNFEEIMEIIFM